MTRKQALIALRDKVKAGECYPRNVLSVFPHYVGDCGQWAHDAYFHGSLDAAWSLHKELLPGWGWGRQSSLCEIYVVDGRGESALARRNKYSGKANNPARAWLIAILEALIAQEPGQ